MTTAIFIFGVSLGSIIAFLSLSWLEYRRGVRFFPSFWRKADARVAALEAYIAKLPEHLKTLASDAAHFGIHLAAVALSYVSTIARELAHMLAARSSHRKRNDRERGSVSFFLQHITEHKRELAARRAEEGKE